MLGPERGISYTPVRELGLEGKGLMLTGIV